MRSIIIPTILLLNLAFACHSLEGGELVVEGNTAFDDAVLRQIAESAKCSGDSSCLDSICRRIASYYWNRGYLDARTHCSVSRDSSIRVNIFEGEEYVVDSIELRGTTKQDSLSLSEQFQDLVGEAFDGTRIQKRMTWLLDFYDQRGYPMASISPEIAGGDENRVQLRFIIDKGPLARLREVVFDGLKLTRKQILLDEMGIREGAPFNGKILKNARSNLLGLGVFEKVSEPRLIFDSMDTSITVEIGVIEAPSTNLTGYAAYSPSSRGSLVGSIDLEFSNLGGTLRRFHINWDKPGYQRLKWMVSYSEPRFLSRPLCASVVAESDVADTIYAHRRLLVSLEWRKSAAAKLGLGFLLGANKDRSLKLAEGDFKEKGLKFRIAYDGQFPNVNPRSGSKFEISQESLILTYSENAKTLRLARLHLLGGNITSLWGNWVLSSKICFDGVFVSNDIVPASYVIRIGGMGSLRGYGEEALTGVRVITATLEPRLILSPNSRFYAFIDGALLGSSRGNLRFESALLGYGCGIMASAGIALVRLDIGLAQHEAWTNARLHFGVVKKF